MFFYKIKNFKKKVKKHGFSNFAKMHILCAASSFGYSMPAPPGGSA